MAEQILITAVMMAANMAINGMRKIEGPRLEDTKVTGADYGTPMNYFYGIRRFEGVPIIFAEDIREVKRRRKTKGGKYNEYTYFGTWAVLVADQEIDAVTRIWFDKHLIYDMTGAGPVTPYSLGSRVNITDNIRIYTGTDTQEPDPRMLATIEDEFGAGSCPAYRRMAYIMFEDVPLEKLGNRIPQISVEAVSSGTPNYPYETKYSDNPPRNLTGFSYSPDYSRAFWGGTSYEIWDVATRSMMIAGDMGEDFSGQIVGISNNGTLYGVADTLLSPKVRIRTPDGISGGGADIPLDHECSHAQILADDDGNEYCCVTPYGNITNYIQYFNVDGGLPVVIDAGFSPTMYFTDADGNIWAVGSPFGSDAIVGFRCIAGPRNGDGGTATAPVSSSAGAYAMDNGEGSFVVAYGNRLFLVDTETYAVGTTVTFSTDNEMMNKFASCPPGASSIWLNNSEINTQTLATIRAVNYSDWVGTDVNGVIYDPVNHALLCAPQFNDEVTWRYLDRVGVAGLTLQDIVEDVCERCGLDAGDVDASDLDQSVTGYSWTQGSGKDILAPLLDVYDSDARPHNFQLQFVKRGDAASGSMIEESDFVRNGDEARYSIRIAQDTDLPTTATLTFADIDADQQSNAATPRRQTGTNDSERTASIDMSTLALDVNDGNQLAERYFRRVWNERETYSLALTAQQLAIEPGDVKTFSFDGITRTARITKLTLRADDSLAVEAVYDTPSLAALSGTAGAAFDGRAEQTILVPVLSKGFLLDIPLIRDADNDTNPILYYAAGPYSSGGSWPGAVIYQGDGTDYDLEFASVAAAAALTWGYSTEALPDGLTSVWDRGNSVNIRMQNGELTSATEADCNANPLLNLILLGEELLQYTDAVLEGDGTYTLSGFKRGRRGTEWATGIHATGDRFILLDAVGNVEMGAADIGDTLYFKASTQGRDIESAFPIEVEYGGESHRPYTPVHIEAEKDSGTGDWSISWIRRSRIGGSWTGGSTVPLGESTEAYEVDIMDGVSVLHTYAVTSPSATYTSADQTTYAGGDVPVGDLDIRVRQVGDLMDGRNAEASF
jgi:hypothetical protein